MAILRKYGVAAIIDGIPLIARGAMDFKAAPTLAAGDVMISPDGDPFVNIEGEGTFSNFVAVLPAGGTSVQVKPDETAMTCKHLVIRFIDQTSPKEWEDQEIIVETYGNALAQHAFDLSVATQAVELASGQINAVADQIWDEQLGLHNAGGTAGRALKKAENIIIHEGTAQDGTADTITLSEDSSIEDGFYDPSIIIITGGTGIGQTRRICGYVGSTQIATVCVDWVVIPDETSKFQILPWASVLVSGVENTVGLTPQQKLDVNAEMVDTLRTDTGTELDAVPAATAPIAQQLQLVYQKIRNKEVIDSGAGTATITTSEGAAAGTATLTDAAGVFTKDKYV